MVGTMTEGTYAITTANFLPKPSKKNGAYTRGVARSKALCWAGQKKKEGYLFWVEARLRVLEAAETLEGSHKVVRTVWVKMDSQRYLKLMANNPGSHQKI